MNIRRQAVWAAGTATVLLLSMLGCRSHLPPDVILITVDTTRVDGLSCYGGPQARTPGLDTLAASAVRFETAITAAPYTGPSHASILTGLDPPRHGLRDFLNQAMDSQVPTLPELLRARGYRTVAYLSSYVLDRRFGLDRGFEVYSCDFWRKASAGSDPEILQGGAEFERRASETMDEAMQFLRRSAGEGVPVFAWIHLFDPHMPYDPPFPCAPREVGSAGTTSEETERARRRYYKEITCMDAQIGRLLSWLRHVGREDRTIVTVVADHGELLGHHGRALGTHSTHLVEATLRVPMIVRVPGLRPAVVRQQVRVVDLMPTVLEALRIPAPAGIDGRSLLPAMRGEPLELPPAYSETLYERFPSVAGPGDELVSLRAGRFRLLRSPLRRELYDLQDDPHELRDVAAEHPDEVQALETQLEALRRRQAPEKTPDALGMDEEERRKHLERLRSLGYAR